MLRCGCVKPHCGFLGRVGDQVCVNYPGVCRGVEERGCRSPGALILCSPGETLPGTHSALLILVLL